MKVGIMGGTFNPVHIAHLIIAEEARTMLELDYVVFIPAGNPWMKTDNVIAPASDRVEMVRLAIKSNEGFRLSTMEVDRQGPSYTVDTLEALLEQLGLETKLFLILGWDSLVEITQWKAPYRISKMSTLVIFPRPGYVRLDDVALEAKIPGISKKLIHFKEPYIGISSTDIRRRLIEGSSIRYLVPDEVAQYIYRNNLYRAVKG